MDTAYSPDDLAFRDEVRGFFQGGVHAGATAANALQSRRRGAKNGSASLNDKGLGGPGLGRSSSAVTGWTATQAADSS